MRGVKGSGKVEITCLCGNKFTTAAYRLKVGRGKYCSKACKNKYSDNKVRKGRKVVFKNPVSSWFKKGIQNNPNGGFKKGQIPHNYKGDMVGYCALHDWVKNYMNKPKLCEHCGENGKRLEWANISHQYKRDLNDWVALCRKCHIKYDRQSGSWGDATKQFNLKSRRKNKCQK